MFAKGGQPPFKSIIVSVSTFIWDVFCVLFVDWVIGQMDKSVFLIFRSRIAFSGKSCKSFFIHIHSQWIPASYKHIYSEIKLMSIYQKGIWNVFWNDLLVCRSKLTQIINNVNSFSLWTCIWLDNPKWFSPFYSLKFFEKFSKFFLFVWKHKCIRSNIETLFTESFLHFEHIDTKLIFTSNFERVWKMIQFLILIKPLIKVWFSRDTKP